MTDRESLARLAQENISICRGGYTAGNRKIDVRASIEFRKSKVYSKEELSSLALPAAGEDALPCKVEVINASAVEAVFSAEDKTGVLNFASQRNPGGGYLNGSTAQEEALCRASTLYAYLEHSRAYYGEGKRSEPGIYAGNMIYSEDVLFFRDNRNTLVEHPVKADVLTSAAVNRKAVPGKYSAKQLNEIMYSRMKAVLTLFAYKQCKRLILGAYGCGVFGNDALFVAKAWKSLLYSENYAPLFSRVTFAVLDRDPAGQNIRAFKSVFKE
jgi:uncharacterized protein (TIGR02452 family)